MAHADQLDFVGMVKEHLPAYFERVKVLEIGSLDINGSIRSCFSQSEYVGIDVAAGPGVDEVCQGQLVGYPTATFDVVISCECLEHNPFWVETVANMFRMAKPGGLVIVSCATTGRAEHGTSRTTKADSPLSIGIGWEYYRNVSIADFKRAFNLEYWCEDYVLLPNWQNCDLYFVGVKKSSQNAALLSRLRASLAKRFRRTQSLRSMCFAVAAITVGEFGIGVLRMLWRSVPKPA